jgi:hypothetical protein
MADLSKNEQMARDFTVAAINNPDFNFKGGVNVFSARIVLLYKTILSKLNADEPKTSTKIHNVQ